MALLFNQNSHLSLSIILMWFSVRTLVLLCPFPSLFPFMQCNLCCWQCKYTLFLLGFNWLGEIAATVLASAGMAASRSTSRPFYCVASWLSPFQCEFSPKLRNGKWAKIILSNLLSLKLHSRVVCSSPMPTCHPALNTILFLLQRELSSHPWYRPLQSTSDWARPR